MYYNQAGAPEGAQFHGRKHHAFHPYFRTQRAAVNVYKTDDSYELMVFAPGRIKENFEVTAKGSELTVSYTPPENLPRPEWIQREYSRGGFRRSFMLDESVDTTNIQAKYTDGVLQISLPIIPGKETKNQTITIN